MLHRVLLQVPVQAEARLAVAPDALQLGQVHQVTGRRPLSIGHGLTGRSVGGAGLGTNRENFNRRRLHVAAGNANQY